MIPESPVFLPVSRRFGESKLTAKNKRAGRKNPHPACKDISR
jgi:hypothetical protein